MSLGYNATFSTTGYRDSMGTHVYVRDWQGNIRAVVRRNAQGVVELEQATYYYPYGMPMAESTNPTINKYKYTGKELLTDKGVNIMDYGARFYDPTTCLWLSPDPHSADYAPIAHYSMCAGDPINHIDPNGMDWYETLKYSFEYDVENETWNINLVGSGEIAYTECTSQSAMDDAGIQGRYLAPIVVVMNGSMNEKLGVKNGKSGYIDGEGAITASVTVYGPGGSDDIGHYTGFSMTSDYKKFGAIADGEYDVKYDVEGKSGSIESHYAINGRGPVDCINGVNPSPSEYNPYSATQKDGIFIHRTNMNGWAGDNPSSHKAVSTGCPLISAKDWNAFQNQIGLNGFKFILTRTR